MGFHFSLSVDNEEVYFRKRKVLERHFIVYQDKNTITDYCNQKFFKSIGYNYHMESLKGLLQMTL